MYNGFPWGSRQSQTAFSVSLRQRLQRIIGGSSNQRNGQDGNSQSTGKQIPLCSHINYKCQITKQADYDGRKGG